MQDDQRKQIDVSMEKLPQIVRERMSLRQPETHPESDLLSAFAEQALPDRERLPVLAHLSVCSSCREVLALAAVPAKSGAFITKDTAASTKAPWFAWPVLRWGAAAACVVVVATAVTLHRSERAAPTSETQISETQAPEQLPAATPAPPSPVANKKNSENEKAADKVARNVAGDFAASPVTRDQAEKRLAVPQREFPLQKGAPDMKQAYAYSSQSAGTSMAAKELRNDWHGAGVNAAPGTVVPGAPTGGLGGAIVPSASAPAPPKSGPPPNAKDVQNLPANGRAFNQLAVQLTEPVEGQAKPVEVQAQLVDGPASADAEKKVEMGRAKTSSASSGAALAVAPSDQLDGMQQGVAPSAPAMSKTKRERASYAHSESTRWNLSFDGQLQRSIDSGKTWQPVATPAGAAFRALSYNGPDIWVGGAAGLLYHSTDAGTHWELVKPAANDVSLTADIAAIAFTDPQHGKITTSNGETWTTSDGGQNWNHQH